MRVTEIFDQICSTNKFHPFLMPIPSNTYTNIIQNVFRISMENGPFIDDLPILKMVIFHGYVSHNQMVMVI